jgi:L-fuculose-phosphate aldolase
MPGAVVSENQSCTKVSDMKAQTTRQNVVDLCRELAGCGFLAGTGGNIALRIDSEHFAVTPSATDYYAMDAADVSVLRIADLRQIEGERPPSVESSLHARVLRARPDCDASIHTHQPVASACALLGRPLAVAEPELQRLLGAQVALVGYAPSGTGWLAAKLSKALQPSINAYLMKNHGVLCCASNFAKAVQTVAALESVAADHLRRQILARAEAEPARRPALQRVLDALAKSAAAAPAVATISSPSTP